MFVALYLVILHFHSLETSTMRSRKIIVQRTTNRMRSSLQALVLATMMQQTVAQTTDTAFTRAVACAADDGIVGYSTIDALNLDMEKELSRIVEDGGAIPTDDYIMTLCPGLISAQAGPLRPILDRVVFMCPDGTECAIDGSTQQQVLIQDSAADGYTIESITFMGVTFSGFNGGVSSSVQATEPTVVSYVNSDWKNFNSISIINVQEDATVQITNGEIGTIDGLANDARAQSFFINRGGVFVVDRLFIRASQATTSAFLNEGNEGDLFINAAFLGGVVTPSVVVSNSGSVLIDNMTVEGSTSLVNMFLVRNSGSKMNINRLTMSNNNNGAAWTGIEVSRGAELKLTNSDIEGNTNLDFGVEAKATNSDEPRVKVEGVIFSGNTAADSAPIKALVAAIGVSTDLTFNSFIDIERVNFNGNSLFTANILSVFGGRTSFRKTCFDGNTGQLFSVFVGKGGEGFQASENYIAVDTEESVVCNADGTDLRVFLESPDGNCFNGDCRGDCTTGGFNITKCFSDIVRSSTPSMVPSPAPPTTSPTAAPSPRPTTAPSTSSPTNSPSRAPTERPSATPTLAPTVSPTVSPVPTSTPNNDPTVSPSGFPSSGPTQAPTITASPTVTVSLSPTGDITPSPSIRDIVTLPPIMNGAGKPGTPECPPFPGQGGDEGRGKGKGRGRGYHGSGAYYDRNGCEIAPPPALKSKKNRSGISAKNSKKLSVSKKVSGKKKKVKSSKKGKKTYQAITKPTRPSVPKGTFTFSLGSLNLRGGGRRDLLVEDEEDASLEYEELEEELEEREEEAEWEDEALEQFEDDQ